MPYPSPDLLPAVLALYETTWPGLGERIELARSLGWDWAAVSTPLVAEVDGAIRAHVGVLEYDLMVDGQIVPACGIHAVCTQPAYRGRGLVRRLMEEALGLVGDRPACLATEVPGVYASHGFVVASEQRWRGLVVDGGAPTRAVPPTAEGAALVERLHADRAPLSRRLTTLAPPWMFGICACLGGAMGTLRYAPALDAILAWVVEDGRAVLWDVLARELPPLGEVLAHLPPGQVEIAFSLDAFDGVPEGFVPVAAPADDLWMVRGLDLPDGVWQMPMLGRH